MFLYLVQHAESLSKEMDQTQPLSEKGKNDINRLADSLFKLKIPLDQIIHSTKLRARQTAEVLGAKLNPPQGYSEQEGLSPLDEPMIWLKGILAMNKNLMLVGHLPHLEKLISLVLGFAPEKKTVSFQRGCCVCLKKEESGSWSIQWMIVPEII
ncbi:MAG: phosphohistidine phosphatase SixA [bacterium]|nr:phosphohistidine phosphatase SixA [bacterium]